MKQDKIIFAVPVLEAAQKCGRYNNLNADIQLFKTKTKQNKAKQKKIQKVNLTCFLLHR